MSAFVTPVCAASDSQTGWHGIRWADCYRRVRRLQARIVKAMQEGRPGKVKALQWLLTHSYSGKVLAVKRVTENPGKRTPGVDGETWSTPESKVQAAQSLSRRGYQPQPLRRVYIPKSNGKKERPLGIPTLRDRAMQALHLQALEPVAETQADRNSYGFRPERSTADAGVQCYLVLAKETAPQWILEGDIKGCFDNISHAWILDHAPMDRTLLEKWLKAGYIYKGNLFPTIAGTPQGGIVSPTLANVALDGLEAALEATFGSKRTRQGNRCQVNRVRYADDFIITSRTKEQLENEVKPLVERFLSERGLTLSAEKTRITPIEDGFDFLGWNLRKYRGKFLMKPSKRNVKAFLQDIRETVKCNPQARQENLIRLLNPKIQGWVNYHQAAVAKRTFSRMDREIWKALWQWAKRRHPNKGLCWIKDRYWHRQGSRNWVFSVTANGKDGTSVNTTLVRPSDTKIRRHIKIKGEANPFDPEWETYFEDRKGKQMQVSLKGRKKLLNLWKEQEGNCPVCNQKITVESGWNIHHLIQRSHGGGDGNANLILAHPNCHRQIHSQGFDVAKPVSTRGL